jgi:tetratricopeptide (TPR) repeat protein
MLDASLNDLERRRSGKKLERLQEFLAFDPANAMLAAEAFDAAFALDRLDAAEQSLAGIALQAPDAAPLRFRLANLRMAQQRLPEAAELLNQLHRELGLHPGLAQTQALLHFIEQNFQQCADTLAPYLDVRSPQWAQTVAQHAQIDRANWAELQMLWLRSLHRLGELEKAWDWVEDSLATDALTPAAAGVACLIALDAGRLTMIEELARRSGSHPACQQEVLLSVGSLRLQRQDNAGAREQLTRALALNDANGRVWSMLGFVDMSDDRLDSALVSFARAVEVMPDHAGTWIGWGWTRLLARLPIAKAKAAFQTALELDENFAECHGCMAVILAMEGHRQEATQFIVKARRLDKRCWSSQFAQMIVDGTARDTASVMRLAQRLIGSVGSKSGRPSGGPGSAQRSAQGKSQAKSPSKMH